MEILNGISKRIKAKFPNIRIESEGDVTEKIVRPCFMVKFDNMTAQDFVNTALDRKITVRIHYFPSNKDKNKIENLNIIDSLNEIFVDDNIIAVNEDFFIEIFDEIEIDVIDKVLHYYFKITLSEDYDRMDNTPTMEDLEVEGSLAMEEIETDA